MEELAKVIVLLALLGSAIAYVRGGWPEVGLFWRMKLAGGPSA